MELPLSTEFEKGNISLNKSYFKDSSGRENCFKINDKITTQFTQAPGKFANNKNYEAEFLIYFKQAIDKTKQKAFFLDFTLNDSIQKDLYTQLEIQRINSLHKESNLNEFQSFRHAFKDPKLQKKKFEEYFLKDEKTKMELMSYLTRKTDSSTYKDVIHKFIKNIPRENSKIEKELIENALNNFCENPDPKMNQRKEEIIAQIEEDYRININGIKTPISTLEKPSLANIDLSYNNFFSTFNSSLNFLCENNFDPEKAKGSSLFRYLTWLGLRDNILKNAQQVFTNLTMQSTQDKSKKIGDCYKFLESIHSKNQSGDLCAHTKGSGIKNNFDKLNTFHILNLCGDLE